jgi:hypothetical protein
VSDRSCTVCGIAKPLTDYSPCRNGFQPSCKACRNHKAVAKNIAVTVSEQRCTACKQTKSAAEFNRSKGRKSGLQKECKLCTGARKSAVHYEVSVVSQVCCDCGTEKPASEFPRATKRVSGIRKECKDCTSIRNRAQLYALTLEEVREMCSVEACDICGSSFSTARDRNIDHCHATGVVRGTLCNLCNRMLGSARDNPAVLETAASYLRATSQEAFCG